MSIIADLGETLEKTVADLVSSGRYGSETDVLREGVKLLQARDDRIAEFEAAIARGVADADAGRVEDGEAFLDRLDEKYRRMGG